MLSFHPARPIECLLLSPRSLYHACLCLPPAPFFPFFFFFIPSLPAPSQRPSLLSPYGLFWEPGSNHKEIDQILLPRLAPPRTAIHVRHDTIRPLRSKEPEDDPTGQKHELTILFGPKSTSRVDRVADRTLKATGQQKTWDDDAEHGLRLNSYRLDLQSLIPSRTNHRVRQLALLGPFFPAITLFLIQDLLANTAAVETTQVAWRSAPATVQ